MCTAWNHYKRFIENKAVLIVKLKTPADLKQDIEDCIKTAAIAGAIAAIVTQNGGAAVAVAERLFQECLEAKVGGNIVSVHISISSRWGDWSRV